MNLAYLKNTLIPAYAPLFAALLLPLWSVAAPGQFQAVAQAPAAETQNRVQRIQQLLGAEGFAPGPPDGLMGTRTVQAIIAFQRREGLTQTGRPDQAVLQRLLTLETSRIAAAQQPKPPPQTDTGASGAAVPASSQPQVQPAATGLSGSRWELIDDSGSRQTIRLLASGKIADAAKPNFWKWRMDGDRLEITYDTGAGGWVRRTGRLTSSDRIAGAATSSRDKSWRWTGRRLNE